MKHITLAHGAGGEVMQGLIKDKQESKFGGRKYIWLTDKGEKIGKHLIEIEKIL